MHLANLVRDGKLDGKAESERNIILGPGMPIHQARRQNKAPLLLHEVNTSLSSLAFPGC